METSSERKRQLWDEESRANAVEMRADGKQWRKKFFLYLGGIAATVVVSTVLAHLAR
jgi:hypothetical protein